MTNPPLPDYPRTATGWNSLGVSALARLAYVDSELPTRVRSTAADRLWVMIQPEVDKKAKRICADSQLDHYCQGPSECMNGFCSAAQDECFHRLFTPTLRDSIPALVAKDPELTDDLVWRRVHALGNGLWTAAQRRILRLNELPQRIDMWLKDSPHSGCVQTTIDDATTDDRELWDHYAMATDARHWLMALSFDAIHENLESPDAARVVRYLSTRGTSVNSAVEQLAPTDTDRRRLNEVVRRVDQALSNLNEHACTVCGGYPQLTPDQRDATALAEVASSASDVVDMLTEAGLVQVSVDGSPVVADGAAGKVLLATRFATHHLTKLGEPTWFERFIEGPRALFAQWLDEQTADTRAAHLSWQASMDAEDSTGNDMPATGPTTVGPPGTISEEHFDG